MWTTGKRLFDATDGRTYSDDAQTRAAKMDLLGDRYGHIENGGRTGRGAGFESLCGGDQEIIAETLDNRAHFVYDN